jgi:hypothetical protein
MAGGTPAIPATMVHSPRQVRNKAALGAGWNAASKYLQVVNQLK